MNRRPKIAALPDPTKDNIVDVARSVKDALDVREGRSGDQMDRFVSFRDLKDLAVIEDGFTIAGDGTKIPGVTPGGGTGNQNFQAPPAPTGFTANGGYGVIILDWDTPPYSNHAYTEIWRNNVDTLTGARVVGTSIASVYTDPVPDAATFYYWIRFVSTTNIKGPYNSNSGTPATSAINVPRVLEALSGEITESQLYDSLRNRIELIDADPTVVGSVAWRVRQQAMETAADITYVREFVRNTAESMALERSIQTASLKELYAGIAEESITRATEDSSLASRLTTIQAVGSTGNKAFLQTTAPASVIYDYAAYVDSYSDLLAAWTAAGGDKATFGYNHWISSGQSEGRTRPSYTLKAGDVWYDTDDGNKSYRWSGSAWVEFRNSVRVFYQNSEPNANTLGPFQVGDLWYDSTNNENKPYRWSGTAWQPIRDGNAQALVTTLEQSKIGYATLNATGDVFDNNGVIKDKAGVDAWNAANPGNLATWNVGLPLATAVKQVSVSDGNGSLRLEQRFTAQRGTNGQLLGQYTVKIDNNGSVSGFGLASTAVDGVPTSEFYVNANRFAITAPSNGTGSSLPGSGAYSGYTFYRTSDKTHWLWNGSAWTSFSPIVPFVVQTTPTTIDGVEVPAGVYMDAAYIKKGTLTTAVIGNSTITNAKIADAAITSAKIANASITSAKIDDSIQSTVFNSTEGWQINKSGTATFNNAVVRGTVYASAGSFSGSVTVGSGTVGGINIWPNSIASSNYSNSAGFAIFNDGSAYFSNITIRDTSGNTLLSSGGRIPWNSLLVPRGIYNEEITISSNGTLQTLNTNNGTTTLGQVTLGGLGAGSLATQNYVAVGTNVYLGGQVMSTSDFVNRLSQINNNNISTFIASGAIGNAYIGNAAIQNANIANAAVSTLSIDGEAVIVPRYSSGVSGGANGNWTGPIASVDFTVTGLASGETANILIMGVLQAYPGDTAESGLHLGVFSGGTLNTEVTSSFAAYGITMACTGNFLVGNGTHNANLRVYVDTNNKPGSTFIGQIIVMAVKR